jgi:hypothetical protein
VGPSHVNLMKAIVWIALGLVTLASALIWSRLTRRYLLAVLGATLSSVPVFQSVVYLHLGYLDPFAPIAALVSMVPCGLVSGVVIAWSGTRRDRRTAPKASTFRFASESRHHQTKEPP